MFAHEVYLCTVPLEHSEIGGPSSSYPIFLTTRTIDAGGYRPRMAIGRIPDPRRELVPGHRRDDTHDSLTCRAVIG